MAHIKTSKGFLEYESHLLHFGDRVINKEVMLDNLKVLSVFLDKIDIKWHDNAAVCVVLASGGYPVEYKKGYEITGLDEVAKRKDIVVFHAGTAEKDGNFVTNGGRVLGITGIGKDLDEAIKIAYEGVEMVDFKDKHFRHDIGIKIYK